VAVQIPFASKSDDMAPLRRCLQSAAERYGVTDYAVSAIMATFLEQLTNEVSGGNVVLIPGFGMFAADRSRHWHKHPEKAYCVPTFSAAGGFRAQVREDCKFTENQGDRIRVHRRGSYPAGKRRSRRGFTAMHTFAENVVKQAEDKGITVHRDDRPPPDHHTGVLP
jgi:nucleoid DNA-binding protein